MLIERQELENYARLNCDNTHDFNVYLRGVVDGYNYFNRNKVKIVQMEHKRTYEEVSLSHVSDSYVEDVIVDKFVQYLKQQGFLNVERKQEDGIITLRVKMKCVK